jgi:hypothetical protein
VIACLLQPGGRFELFCPIASLEDMTIKCVKAGWGLEQPWEGGAANIFSGENNNFFVGGRGGRKEVAIYGQAIEFDCTTCSPTSSTPQSNGNQSGQLKRQQGGGKQRG